MLKFVLVVLAIGLLVYLLVRAIERRGLRRGRGFPGFGSGPTAPPPRGPIGPDDDPDFIWGLNKKKRHPDEDQP